MWARVIRDAGNMAGASYSELARDPMVDETKGGKKLKKYGELIVIEPSRRVASFSFLPKAKV